MRTRNLIVTIVTLATLVFGLGSTALAAGPGKKNHKGARFNVEKRVEKMTERLDLDEAQAKKIKVILERSKEDMKALKSTKQDRSEKRKEFRAIRDSARAEIDAVLTPAQLQKAEALRAEAKKDRKQKRQRRGDRMMRGMKKKLDLSDEQVSTIKEIRKEARTETKKIVRDDFGGDREAASDTIQARRQRMLTDIEAVLTPAQVAKFAKFRDRMVEKRSKRGEGRHGKHGQ